MCFLFLSLNLQAEVYFSGWMLPLSSQCNWVMGISPFNRWIIEQSLWLTRHRTDDSHQRKSIRKHIGPDETEGKDCVCSAVSSHQTAVFPPSRTSDSLASAFCIHTHAHKTFECVFAFSAGALSQMDVQHILELHEADQLGMLLAQEMPAKLRRCLAYYLPIVLVMMCRNDAIGHICKGLQDSPAAQNCCFWHFNFCHLINVLW